MGTEHTVATGTHGRYLVSTGASAGALIVGFHGYGENAEEEMLRLQKIPEIDWWTIASIQGLHQFYRRRTNEIVASWMTRQNRELAIADNITYVSRIVNHLTVERPGPLVFTGFSQGVAMAFRAAAVVSGPIALVIACGGEVPPELDTSALSRIPAAMLCRGKQDEWYTAEKQAADEARLRAAGVTVQSFVIDTGHEWTGEFSEACGRALRTLLNP